MGPGETKSCCVCMGTRGEGWGWDKEGEEVLETDHDAECPTGASSDYCDVAELFLEWSFCFQFETVRVEDASF